MTSGHLPAWLAGPALGVLTVAYWILLRRPLGVSGVVARFTRISEEREFDRGTAALDADAAALEAAMVAATAEAFGDSGPAGAPARAPQAQTPRGGEPRPCAPTPPLSAHLTFLVAIAAGGLTVSLLRGAFGAGMGDAFAHRLGASPVSLVALGAGGLLVGFGTSLSGGCSAGHGLTGCGRLMPASLLATATFFAAASAVSFLIG